MDAMRATTIHAPRDIRFGEAPDPTLQRPTDALVEVVRSCICGSDLWPYRGANEVTPDARIGHEFVGIVREVGEQVGTVRVGDFVIAPFSWGDNTCPVCQRGVNTSCLNGGWWGAPDREGLLVDGGQGQFVRVPLADGTLVATPGMPAPDQYADLLTLSDVMGTGWHCALGAQVSPGDTVVVVGDGAVGLCAVLSARLQGAERIIAMSRHADRQAIAREFGATDVVEARGRDGVKAIKALTGGLGADAALECVGTDDSMKQAIGAVRAGGRVGFVGVPHGIEVPMDVLFGKNISLAGGVASVRQYIPALLDRVWAGDIHPGRVFDLELPMEQVADGYRAMDERRATKVMLVP